MTTKGNELPHHPQGVPVRKGDTVRLSNLSVRAVEVDTSRADAMRPRLRAKVPDWSTEHAAGASFILTQRFEPRDINLPGAKAHVSESTLAIAFIERPTDLLATAVDWANRTLDVLAAETFLCAELEDPLREHCVWWNTNDARVLRLVWTEKSSLAAGPTSIEVVGADGSLRNPPKAASPRQWDPSLIYFRRSQASENAGDSYRYLFLALESILASLRPQKPNEGEGEWLKTALRRVAQEYDLDLARYVSEGASDPVEAFMIEHYVGARCALFHAKSSRGALRPEDLEHRKALLKPIESVGRLYIDIATRATGLSFRTSWFNPAHITRGALERLDDPLLYLASESGSDAVAASSPSVADGADSLLGIPRYEATFDPTAAPTEVREVGITCSTGDTREKAWVADVNLCLHNVDRLEVWMQYELVNQQHIRTNFV